MKSKHCLIAGSVLCFLGVALGAFAAHGLKLDLYQAGIWETAVRYQFYHALALILVGVVFAKGISGHTIHSGLFFLIGVILFSGSLYAIVLTGHRWLGAITPLGGSFFLIGWALLIHDFWRSHE